ncbi:hypothetical protein [Streptomyces sp. NBC_00236]|uniref:hypothetical protein n=1 Tax=Streptomyces sp. NBC_00236 TaxID=2903639 RepID=UPI002E29D520|nr:hypothetical protein [Streptomyces sp. NBC_00236]
MSAPEECGALTSRSSLYLCAVSVALAEPEGLWSLEYVTPPDRTKPGRRPRRGWQQTRAELTDVLIPLLVDPDAASAAETLQRRLAAMDPAVRHRSIHLIVRGLSLENEARARALARCLVRTGRSAESVCVGLALLTRLGEPEDVPCLETLGLLRDLVHPVIRALDSIDRRAAARIHLRNEAAKPELRRLLGALGAGDDAAVRERLVALPRTIGPEDARRAAEASELVRLLELDEAVAGSSGRAGTPHVRTSELVAQAAWLLFQMTCVRDSTPEILAYREAVRAYESLARGAARHLTPTLDHYALLLSAAQELAGGAGALHDWGGSGRREAAVAELVAVLDRPEWRTVVDRDGQGRPGGVRRRAEWARRVRRQLAHRPAATAEGLRIEVAERDPLEPGPVEARIVVDGRPLVPAVFGRGPVHGPEWLLDSGRLRATEEPREVELAEAYCSEGCCGALYVTIRRDGGEVVWSDWRCPPPPLSALHVREIPELRFDAAAYDAEIRRAENDHTWTWPARKAARLIVAGLRDRPELLTRWGMELSWAGTAFSDLDQIVLSLRYAGEDGSPTYRMWCIQEDGTPPEDRAADALRRLASEDPRTYGA